MSDIQQRIAEIQRKHREELNEEGVCICGWHAHLDHDYPQHVAAMVVSGLGLQLSLGGQWIAYSVPYMERSER